MSDPVDPGAAPGGESVERELDRLESIVEELSADGIELDVALRLFEEGVARLRGVTSRLNAADARVKLLEESDDGSFELGDFDA